MLSRMPSFLMRARYSSMSRALMYLEKATTLTDEHHQTTTGVIVLLVHLQVLGEGCGCAP